MINIPVTIGLYRHFKGAYYYVTGLSHDALDEKTIMVNYFNVCHPEYGSCVRPLDSFTATVEDDGRIIQERPDNKTGQIQRFERIKEIDFQIGSVSTEQLIAELRGREDSPLQNLDIKGLSDCVFCSDYIVGDKHYETEEYPRGVTTVVSFTTEEEAKRYYETHILRKQVTKVFKRVFIEVE